MKNGLQLLLSMFLCGTLWAGDVTLIPASSQWKYLDDGIDQGTAWQAVGFDDAIWPDGFAEFGYGDGDETTVLDFGPDPNNKHLTYYFRKNFTVSDPAQYKNLYVALLVDDGAVVYLNGVEMVRHNMPLGPIDFMTESTVLVDGHFERIYYYFAIDPNILVDGNNVIAVEVHQQRANSSDVSFNLQLIASHEYRVVARGEMWRYHDQGVDQGTAWYGVGFNDLAWPEGKAILGYNTTASSRLENTTIGFGGVNSNKYRTSYFRKTISISDVNDFDELELNLLLDDGAVVYINGVEAGRQNMPEGTIVFSTFASVTVGTATWYTLPIDKSLLVNGINEFAVEVHQVSVNSSDKYFEFELREMPPPPLQGGGCTSETIGCFTSVNNGCQTQGFIFPSTHTFQYIMAQNDTYSTGGGSMGGNHDFTGYLPIDGSSELGYLLVNHENTTGSVSLLGMHFNPYSALWEVDSSKRILFNDVAGTSRNCSGGITYWGTTVTSEETMTGGDSNGDGYTDLGWHIEIDPHTGKPRDYDNDGTPDKMWALGRSNKENIVFLPDSVTAYFGLDDSNNGFIYKFIADQKTDFSSGNLYVLVHANINTPTATWVQVPNTTKADRNNSQSIANSLGARNYQRVEDVEVGPDGKIYFAATSPGRVYRFKDDGATVSEFEIYIEKQNYTFATETGVGSALFEWADNLAFDAEGNLWINADGGCSHIWMARANHSMADPQMELFARTPNGSESTGITFSPDGRFMFVSIQHPNTGNTAVNVDAAGNAIVFNRSTSIVMARKEHLGEMAAIPYIDLGTKQTVCPDQTVVLDAGAGMNNYSWSNNATTQTIEITTPGIYEVTVTAPNGKTNTASVEIEHLSLPSVTIQASSAAICVGEDVTLSVSGLSSFNWSNGVEDGELFTPLSTQLYEVSGLGANGCFNSATVEIVVNELPQINVQASSLAICNGEDVTLNGSGAETYTWSDDIIDGQSFIPAGTAMYSVSGTDANGCEGSADVTITVNELPNVVAHTSDFAVCEGDNVVLYGSGAETYTWSDNVINNVAFIPANTSTYTVRGTDVNGCESEDQLVITVNELPVIDVTVSANTICDGDEVTIAASALDAQLTWNPTIQDGEAFIPTETETYTVTAENTNGCIATESIEIVVNELPIVEIEGLENTYEHTDPTVSLTGVPAGGVFSGSGVTNSTFSPSEAGQGTHTITYSYTDPLTNCSAEITQDVDVMLNTAGLEAIGSQGSFAVYPNPFENELTVQVVTSKQMELTIRLTDVTGKEVRMIRQMATEGMQSIQVMGLDELSSGIYVLTVRLGDSQQVRQLVRR